MHEVIRTNRFKKQFKKLQAQGYDLSELKKVIQILMEGNALPKKYKDHKWNDTKEYRDVRECHIAPDWLLIYKIDKKASKLYLFDTGSHSELL